MHLEKLFHKCQLHLLYSWGQHEEVQRFKRRLWASLVTLVVENLPASAGDMRHGFEPWVSKMLWRVRHN